MTNRSSSAACFCFRKSDSDLLDRIVNKCSIFFLKNCEPSGVAVLDGQSRALQLFPAGIPGIQVMPELNVLLVLLPAEKDFTTVDDGGEIYEAAVKVLDLDFT
jgi:hypothetical protein